jgi:hypothetical protein
LIASGGRGEVIVDGRTIPIVAGVETVIPVESRASDVVVEAWLREGTGEATWRFGFGPLAVGNPAVRNVVTGEPALVGPDSVVFRVRGKLPQRIAFVVRPARAE